MTDYQVPDGMIAVTISDGLAGTRKVKTLPEGATIEDALGDYAGRADVTYVVRRGGLILNDPEPNEPLSDRDHVSITPTKQKVG